MRTRFDPERGLIVVRALIHGPDGDRAVRLALDTGATATMVNTAVLVSLGYDPAAAAERVRVTTGSGVEFTPRMVVQKIEALGQSHLDFSLLSHTLPPTTTVDGVLGLDFMRRRRLIVDFRAGRLSLE